MHPARPGRGPARPAEPTQSSPACSAQAPPRAPPTGPASGWPGEDAASLFFLTADRRIELFGRRRLVAGNAVAALQPAPEVHFGAARGAEGLGLFGRGGTAHGAALAAFFQWNYSVFRHKAFKLRDFKAAVVP